MKKGLLFVGMAALAAAGSLAGCGKDKGKEMKVGVVCIGDENATYDKNFMNALDKVAENKNVKVLYKKNVAEEGNASYEAAVELAEMGCEVVIGNSFGFEDNIIKAAKEYKEVMFGHCTGVKAHTEKLPNYSNGFASIYEGRYLAGIAAGMKLNTLGSTAADHVLGYVGAYTYAEVVSGYTAFYLGAKSVCPDATMMVQFTGNWGNTNDESSAATNLLSKGAKLISQHADTYGAPSVCDAQSPKVANVAYNVSTEGKYPDSYLCYSAINWEGYFSYLVDCKRNGEQAKYDYTGTLKDGAVVVGKAGKCAAPGTQAAMDAAAAELKAGTRHVFDTNNFTVTVIPADEKGENGKNTGATVDGEGHLTAYLADTDGDYAGDTNVVSDGFFHESEKRSAPYFDVDIDGISRLNVKF